MTTAPTTPPQAAPRPGMSSIMEGIEAPKRAPIDARWSPRTRRTVAVASGAVALAALLGAFGGSEVAFAAPTAAADPCVKVAGKTFVPPADALACLKSFPFNETLRQNVLTVVDRVFNFYTFEDYYLNSPPPFQDSTVNIRAQLKRINTTKYAVSLRVLAGLFCGVARRRRLTEVMSADGL